MFEHDQMLLTKYHEEYFRLSASTGIRTTPVRGFCHCPKFSGHGTEAVCEFRDKLLPSYAVLSDSQARNERRLSGREEWCGPGGAQLR